jgi:2-methylisocitrate lyase-like PEP mutase family enzyme
VTTARQLRSLLEDSDSHFVPGVYDAMTARIGEAAGFEILFLTGFGVAATLVGVPDIGLVTMTESVDVCRRVCDVVTRPVIADADTGYGNALSVRRTVRAFETAGAAGLHLEDQVAPKRCGHMTGKQVISTDEMVGKLGSALDARQNDDFCIIARTDARSVEGLAAAIERAHVYRAAGADMLFVEAPQSVAEMERIATELDCPLIFNWSYDGVTPHVSRSWLTSLGYKFILFPDIVFAAHHALTSFAMRLAETDSLDPLAEQMTGFEAFNDFVELRRWRQLESRYVDESFREPATTQEVP